MQEPLIYHLCRRSDWLAAQEKGLYQCAAEARRDGFLHFSTAERIAESAARHRAGEPELMLLTVAAGRLGPALRWEPSRDGRAFPHLYGALPLDAVTAVDPLPLGPDGRHRFPPLAGRRR
jgi:uncharacterized protein (DUF952 family)